MKLDSTFFEDIKYIFILANYIYFSVKNEKWYRPKDISGLKNSQFEIILIYSIISFSSLELLWDYCTFDFKPRKKCEGFNSLDIGGRFTYPLREIMRCSNEFFKIFFCCVPNSTIFSIHMFLNLYYPLFTTKNLKSSFCGDSHLQ